jgi:MFS family permease
MQAKRQPGIPFILVTVFLDTLAFGFVIPVLPALVATMTPDEHSQAYWYGLLLGSFGLAQFFSAPLLGAISDRWGRRTVLLISIFGLGLNFLITAVSPWLWLLLVSRLIGGASGAAFTVAGAYVADVTPEEQRSRSFGLLGAMFGLGFICGPILGAGWRNLLRGRNCPGNRSGASLQSFPPEGTVRRTSDGAVGALEGRQLAFRASRKYENAWYYCKIIQI